MTYHDIHQTFINDTWQSVAGMAWEISQTLGKCCVIFDLTEDTEGGNFANFCTAQDMNAPPEVSELVKANDPRTSVIYVFMDGEGVAAYTATKTPTPPDCHYKQTAI